MSVYLKSKYGIDIKEEVGKIPQRQLMNLYAKKGFCIEREAYRLSSASLFNYFALTLTILKKEFKITAKQLQYFTDKFIDYIDTLANYKQLKYVGDEFVKGMFHDLWDSTIKKSDLDRYSWDANPWVWVIEFEMCEKPEGV